MVWIFYVSDLEFEQHCPQETTLFQNEVAFQYAIELYNVPCKVTLLATWPLNTGAMLKRIERFIFISF